MKREPLTIVNADTGETFDVELPEDVWRDLETFAAVTGMSVEAVIQTAIARACDDLFDDEPVS